LKKAEELGVESIVFPAFGTGVGRFPYREAARVMKEAVEETMGRESSIKRVIFVLYGREAYETFKEEIR
jgi:O-acetyl-ADP-ribose deacetylase (regulator of RNase III)